MPTSLRTTHNHTLKSPSMRDDLQKAWNPEGYNKKLTIATKKGGQRSKKSVKYASRSKYAHREGGKKLLKAVAIVQAQKKTATS